MRACPMSNHSRVTSPTQHGLDSLLTPAFFDSNEKNFTDAQINNEIFPWSTYFQLVFTVLLGPFAHAVGYVPFIVMGTVARMLTRVLLVWGPPGNVACQQGTPRDRPARTL